MSEPEFVTDEAIEIPDGATCVDTIQFDGGLVRVGGLTSTGERFRSNWMPLKTTPPELDGKEIHTRGYRIVVADLPENEKARHSEE